MGKDIMQAMRGRKEELPQLLPGQFGFCIDTDEVFIGNGDGNANIQMGAKGEKGDKGDKGEKGDTGEVNTEEAFNSPDFTGIPTAPTAPVGTATQQIATTRFVANLLDVTDRAIDSVCKELFPTVMIGSYPKCDRVECNVTTIGNNDGINDVYVDIPYIPALTISKNDLLTIEYEGSDDELYEEASVLPIKSVQRRCNTDGDGYGYLTRCGWRLCVTPRTGELIDTINDESRFISIFAPEPTEYLGNLISDADIQVGGLFTIENMLSTSIGSPHLNEFVLYVNDEVGYLIDRQIPANSVCMCVLTRHPKTGVDHYDGSITVIKETR